MPLSTILLITGSVGALILTIVVFYNKGIFWLGEQLATLRLTLDNHATMIETHSERMATTEERYIRMAADLQRLIGRSEADRVEGFNERIRDRRKG